MYFLIKHHFFCVLLLLALSCGGKEDNTSTSDESGEGGSEEDGTTDVPAPQAASISVSSINEDGTVTVEGTINNNYEVRVSNCSLDEIPANTSIVLESRVQTSDDGSFSTNVFARIGNTLCVSQINSRGVESIPLELSVDDPCDDRSDNDGDHWFKPSCGGTDCDDSDPDKNPGTDEDGDGYATCPILRLDRAADCDDTDPDKNPGTDDDGDGYATCAITTLNRAADCDDSDTTIYTGAAELCDGKDNDCNGTVDLNEPSLNVVDNDGDGYYTCPVLALDRGADCDDNDFHVFPPDNTDTSGFIRPCQPIIYPGTAGEWHQFRIYDPDYFYDDASSTHYIYFAGNEKSTLTTIGYTTSSDGLDWADPTGPILQPNGAGWDVREVKHPWVQYVPGETRPYVMVYSARDGATSQTPNRRRIGLATATDPEGPWAKQDMNGNNLNNPMLAPSATASYLDSDSITFPALRYDADNDRFDLWYTGKQRNVAGLRIFYARSTDLLNWTKTDNTLPAGPDVILDYEDTWEGSALRAVSWLENPQPLGPELEFWYRGDMGTPTTIKIGYANGSAIAWERGETNPVLAPDSQTRRFDANGISSQSVRYDPSLKAYMMYYHGEPLASNDPQSADYDPVYGNFDGVAGYIATAINYAPIIQINTPDTVASSMTFSGTISDSSPDLVTVTLISNRNGALGTASVETVAALGGRQNAIWTLNVSGLVTGLHTIAARAVDEAGITRNTSIDITVP